MNATGVRMVKRQTDQKPVSSGSAAETISGADAYKLFRRHTAECPSESREDRGCKCPIYADIRIHDKWVRRSTGLRDWSRAERKAEKWIEKPRPSALCDARITIPDAINQYLDDCRTRNLAESTLGSYERLLHDLHIHLIGRADLISEINTPLLQGFRNARKIKASTQLKELTYLRTFFHWCIANEWIAKNPASALRAPEVDSLPTMPLEQDEVERLLGAIYMLRNNNRKALHRAQLRARATLLVLLYTGLRISDTVQLRRDVVNIHTGRILLRRMQKTGQPLYVKVPPIVIQSLTDLPRESDTYWLWNGKAKVDTIAGSLARTIDKLGEITGINVHPHRFRDTFSCRLLEHGASMRTVQQLLGHKSIRTTEKHYAPWVASHQKVLDEATDTLDFVRDDGKHKK